MIIVDDDSIISYRESKSKIKNKSDDKEINKYERESENIDYISVRVRHNSITNIKSNKSCKNDDNKNFENIVYRDERGRRYSRINIKSY